MVQLKRHLGDVGHRPPIAEKISEAPPFPGEELRWDIEAVPIGQARSYSCHEQNKVAYSP